MELSIGCIIAYVSSDLLMALLDVSAAFVCVNHGILLRS